MSDRTSSPFFNADLNAYGNLFSFMGLPLSRELSETVDAVVMGVPYDLATTGRSGARFGPNGIRQASAQLRWEQARWPWRFSLAERLRVIDYGDLAYEEGNRTALETMVTDTADGIFAAGKTLLTLGGDHFITLPLLRACAKHHRNLALVHFDAHTDTEEGTLNHGSMFYHAPREGLIDTSASIQVGVRTEYDYDNHPFLVLDGSWINNHSTEEIVARICRRVGDRPVYLSFDIDCLDPAFAPGTGTPVAGGVTTDKALQIIRNLQSLNLVAMDIMEVAPAYDHAEVTSLAAATLGLEMLYLIASRR